MDLLNNASQSFSFILLSDLFLISIFSKVSKGTIGFFLFGPDTYLSHTGFFFSILIIIDVVTLDIFASQFGVSVGE
jgi:hypothetical protein